jgi:hypothetical protein
MVESGFRAGFDRIAMGGEFVDQRWTRGDGHEGVEASEWGGPLVKLEVCLALPCIPFHTCLGSPRRKRGALSAGYPRDQLS